MAIDRGQNDFELVRGTGSVFRDLGDPDADVKQAKAILAVRIIGVLEAHGLSVRKAASETGFAAADFSRVRNADLGRFTLDRLIRMLRALDDTVEVTIRLETRSDWSSGADDESKLRTLRSALVEGEESAVSERTVDEIFAAAHRRHQSRNG